MSEITLEALRLREKELSLDAVLIRGRIEELRHIIAEMERRRGGRPRKSAEAADTGITPLRVTGGSADALVDEGGELPE